MFTCLGKSQLVRDKEAQCILTPNFEKVRDYYRICIISYFENIQFFMRFLNQSDVIDTFFWDGNRIANFFSKNITSKHARESTSIIASESSTKKSSILVSDYSDFCHYFCCFFLFCHTSHFRQKFENVLALQCLRHNHNT